MMKIAIVGASYLQLPLIKRAKERKIETHVFAWPVGDIGENEADFFYPISIVEKESVLEKCKEIGIDGICSIASDLAMHTVNYVANEMGLIGNSIECTKVSTNKYYMREQFKLCGDPSVNFSVIHNLDEINEININTPIIVKPVDRSGSRGIAKVDEIKDLSNAVLNAFKYGFKKEVIIEEYIPGEEYSVESISWQGVHTVLAITKKFTTGSPTYIETGHMEPVHLDDCIRRRVIEVVTHALSSLGIRYGASHSEIKIDGDDIRIIEIGGRMGGDCIGSDLVYLSTGVDFVDAVLSVAIGEKPNIKKTYERAAAIRYVLGEEDIEIVNRIKKEHPEYVIRENIEKMDNRKITDSSNRYGYILMSAESVDELITYMPV